MRSRSTLPPSQNGATLVVGLIMLVLFTLVVIAAGRNITQQVTMAGNTRDREVAFEAAESALRDAQARIPVFHSSFSGTGLVVTSTTQDLAQRSTGDYWISPSPGYGWYQTNGAVDTSKSLLSATALSGVDAQPRFVVERLPNGPTPGACGTITHYRYRVTAVAVGASTGTRKSADTSVVLQAEYRYCAI